MVVTHWVGARYFRENNSIYLLMTSGERNAEVCHSKLSQWHGQCMAELIYNNMPIILKKRNSKCVRCDGVIVSMSLQNKNIILGYVWPSHSWLCLGRSWIQFFSGGAFNEVWKFLYLGIYAPACQMKCVRVYMRFYQRSSVISGYRWNSTVQKRGPPKQRREDWRFKLLCPFKFC